MGCSEGALMRKRITTLCLMIGAVFSISAIALYIWAESSLTRSAIKGHRAIMVDLDKEKIAVGSLHGSVKTRISVEKEEVHERKPRSYTPVPGFIVGAAEQQNEISAP